MSQAWVKKQATIARHLSYGHSEISEYDPLDDGTGTFNKSSGSQYRGGSVMSSSVGGFSALDGVPFTSNADGFRNILVNNSNLLLICVPLGIMMGFLEWSPAWIFWMNFCGMVPLARLLGVATEELAIGLHNDTLGGLLNATFGNAVEMIIVIQALNSGQTELVKYSLLGSIFSNLLLVLGMSFFIGGLGEPGKELFFQETGAMINVTMLCVSCVSVAVPTLFLTGAGSMSEYDELKVLDLEVSRVCSCIIICCYIAYLIFQLYTHIDLFVDEESDEEPQITIKASFVMLFIVTILISVSSEYLVSSVNGLCSTSGLNPNFVGMILIPIIGNACEHASAVTMSIMGRPVISVGIAVGSSVQIALLVIPFAVLTGWAMDVPMDLAFPLISVPILTLTVLVVFSIILNGRVNWLEGLLLIATYSIIAVMYWFLRPGMDDGPTFVVQGGGARPVNATSVMMSPF